MKDDSAGAGWRSYDPIAVRYDRIHASRFGHPAQDLAAMAVPPGAMRVLDVGTGPGYAAVVAMELVAGRGGVIVGIDRSLEMLRLAGAHGIRSRICGEATKLPFRDAAFDAAMANLVLSHFARPAEALGEIARVILPGGRLGVTAWAAGASEMAKLWKQVAEDFVAADLLTRADSEGVPAEKLLENPGVLHDLLAGAGLQGVRVEARVYTVSQSLADYLVGRETTFSARIMRHHLAESAWNEFRRRLELAFRARHSDPVQVVDEVLFAIGTRA